MILSKYVLKDIVIQFLSFLVMINLILIVSQVVHLAEIIIAFGFSAENLLLPLVFMTLPILSQTLPLAVYFGVMSVVARLCLDGEYPAFLACGLSLRDITKPILLFATGAYILGCYSSTYFEAWGRRQLTQFLYQKTQTELDSIIKNKLQPGVFYADFIGYVLYAEEISKDRRKLFHLILAPRSRGQNDTSFTLFAPEGQITGSVEEGNLNLVLHNSYSVATKNDGAEVTTVNLDYISLDLLKVFPQQFFGENSDAEDYRGLGPVELWNYLKDQEADGTPDIKKFRRAAYLFHQRIGGPFIIVILALLGTVLGITDVRRGKSNSYYIAITVIIFAYLAIMGFKWFSEQGLMHPLVAVWLPNIVLLYFALWALFQRDRLPISESLLARKNWPQGIQKIFHYIHL